MGCLLWRELRRSTERQVWALSRRDVNVWNDRFQVWRNSATLGIWGMSARLPLEAH